MQLSFSIAPFGEQLNYLTQRHVTRSLPVSDQEVGHLAAVVAEHLQVIERYSAVSRERSVLYEFGAGWELAMPLILWAMGVERQILIDRRRLLRPALVNHTLEQIRRLGLEPGVSRRPTRFLEGDFTDSIRTLRQHYGIDYRAPLEASHTEIPSGSIDLIIAFNTLEHIPVQALGPILRECRRILKPEGLMLFKIDYQDHYSYLDSNISVYNFLRYSDWQWKIFNPSLHYQNRLRHGDYLAFFKSACLDLIEEKRIEPTDSDLEQVGTLRLAARFRSRQPAELAVRGAFVVLGRGRQCSN